MKKLKFIVGILLVALALVLTLLALVFPDNGLFTTLWNAGVFTFRGTGSLMVIYLTSGLLCVLGVCLLVAYFKGKGEV